MLVDYSFSRKITCLLLRVSYTNCLTYSVLICVAGLVRAVLNLWPNRNTHDQLFPFFSCNLARLLLFWPPDSLPAGTSDDIRNKLTNLVSQYIQPFSVKIIDDKLGHKAAFVQTKVGSCTSRHVNLTFIGNSHRKTQSCSLKPHSF